MRLYKVLDLTGRVFGRLTVVRLDSKDRYGARWHCSCECGGNRVVRGTALRDGTTRSCSCLSRELAAARSKRDGSRRARRHGHTSETGVRKRTSTYISWASARQRVLDPNHQNYPLYGGRGIAMAPRWLESFECFLADMGERPKGHTLDRIDPNGHYAPGNCRWATPLQQRHNQRARADA